MRAKPITRHARFEDVRPATRTWGMRGFGLDFGVQSQGPTSFTSTASFLAQPSYSAATAVSPSAIVVYSAKDATDAADYFRRLLHYEAVALVGLNAAPQLFSDARHQIVITDNSNWANEYRKYYHTVLNKYGLNAAQRLQSATMDAVYDPLWGTGTPKTLAVYAALDKLASVPPTISKEDTKKLIANLVGGGTDGGTTKTDTKTFVATSKYACAPCESRHPGTLGAGDPGCYPDTKCADEVKPPPSAEEKEKEEGMSTTTKALLIGGGVLAAGAIGTAIYMATRKRKAG